jgi:multidrug transporter EmrE-like cation transporter
MSLYIYAFISTVLEIFGDYLFKKGHPLLGSLSYLLGILPWFLILKDTDLSRAIVLFTALNVIGCVLIGRLALHETITPQHYLGLGFCLLGIILT